jgi:hypothetical protein
LQWLVRKCYYEFVGWLETNEKQRLNKMANSNLVTIMHHKLGKITGNARRADASDPFEPEWLPGNPENCPPFDQWLIVDNKNGDFCAYNNQIIKGEIA